MDGSQSETVAPVAEPKTLTQEEVDRVVKREKAELAAREAKIRQELQAAHAAELDKLKTGQTAALGGMTGSVDTEKLYQDFSTKFQRDLRAQQDAIAAEAREAEMRRVADTYFSKLKAAKERYNDFDEIMGDFEHEAFPQIVHAVSGMENAGDIMYELSKNPLKLQQIDYWLNKMPNRGMVELQKLADSISQNRAAAAEYEPTNPPLSETRPSNVGADRGNMTLEDLKQADWLKF